MEVFYNPIVTDGLFQNEWIMKDGTPHGRKFCHESKHLNGERSLSFRHLDQIFDWRQSCSGYEHLLKQWIQSGDPKARQQFTYLNLTYLSLPILLFFYKSRYQIC